MNIKKIACFVLVCVLGCGGYYALQKNDFYGFFAEKFFYAGTLEATRFVVPSRLPSKIMQFDVMEGDRLAKGQTIAQLDDAELKISLKEITSQYERCKKLYENGHYAQSDFESLEAKKDDLELKIKWCTIESPIDGVILSKYKQCGEWGMQGTGIISVADIKHIKAIFYVEHDKIAFLKIGMPVSCSVPEIPGRTFQGRITVINSEPEFTPKNVQTRTERTRLVYGIRVDFENQDESLKPGMTIETQFAEIKSNPSGK